MGVQVPSGGYELGFPVTTPQGTAYALGLVASDATGNALPSTITSVQRIPSVSAGGSPTVLKNAAGVLSGFSGLNTTATLHWLHVYNKATAPVLGTDTPAYSFPIVASAAFSGTLPGGVLAFATGISFAITTDVAGANAPAAGAITGIMVMGA